MIYLLEARNIQTKFNFTPNVCSRQVSSSSSFVQVSSVWKWEWNGIRLYILGSANGAYVKLSKGSTKHFLIFFLSCVATSFAVDLFLIYFWSYMDLFKHMYFQIYYLKPSIQTTKYRIILWRLRKYGSTSLKICDIKKLILAMQYYNNYKVLK